MLFDFLIRRNAVSRISGEAVTVGFEGDLLADVEVLGQYLSGSGLIGVKKSVRLRQGAQRALDDGGFIVERSLRNDEARDEIDVFVRHGSEQVQFMAIAGDEHRGRGKNGDVNRPGELRR